MRAIVWSIKSIAVGHISVNKEANPNYKHGYVVTCRINNEVHACKIYLHAVMDISVFSSVFVLSYWFQLTKRKCDRWAIQMHIRIPMCSRVQPRCSFFCVRSRPHWLFASSRIIQFGQWSSNCCVEHVTSERWLFFNHREIIRDEKLRRILHGQKKGKMSCEIHWCVPFNPLRWQLVHGP